ncbi:leucyl aminopeptidase (aminopeptidase T) [Caldisphaera lagunensis DSM 15908]|uniref:Leucyl aminopeptidase (Aminopeptidase T) n=1 Tax=Caldisphaera lagunensis (strain DSM 15908 / JCM 11604 / ANMR 0165 / IC-154) TaxID=1056495 RepID=L0A983_CALLD|nr:leucyl aminopeptidase [Caldisphaera lagunensis]AFZ69984.1 leucyl aminopeptidase (aminopeptidase T) [Caldisphaera lagunensis DSM 15908]
MTAELSKLSIEVSFSAYKLVKDILKVEPGEEVIITADTRSDMNVVNETAKAVKLLSGKPLIVVFESPPEVGHAAEKYIPVSSLSSLMESPDVWIEFNKSWLLYSKVYEKAISNGKTRYMCLVGMDSDMMVRTIGRVDIKKIFELQNKLAEITKKSSKMRITNPNGMEVTFSNDPERPVLVEGEVNGPGEYMLLGQVDWAPIEDSIEGTIVFDGSVWPPESLGLLKSPIKLHLEKGYIKEIEGGYEAKIYERWLKSLNDRNMFRVAHISYGVNPGAKLTGNILEDERIFGAVEWGLGNQSQTFKGKLGSAISHSDGISLYPTVWVDTTKLIENGNFVHEDLKTIINSLIVG